MATTTKVIGIITDQKECLDGIAFFSDGMIAVYSEKSYAEFGPDGVCVQSTWKLEPQSLHYSLLEGDLSEVPQIKAAERFSDDHSTAFEAMCHELSRRGAGQSFTGNKPNETSH